MNRSRPHWISRFRRDAVAALSVAVVAGALLLPGRAPALSITFTKVADGSGVPLLDQGTVAYVVPGPGPGIPSAIVTQTGGTEQTIVDTSTVVPGTATTFQGFGEPSSSGGAVAFREVAGAGTYNGIFVGSGGPVQPIVDTNTAVPGSAQTFSLLQNPSIHAGTVAFEGRAGSGGYNGIFTGSGGALQTIADTSTTVPGTASTFATLRNPSIDAGTVAFQGDAGIGMNGGIFLGSGGPLQTIANTSTVVPGTALTFETLRDPSHDAGAVAFHGTADFATYGGIFIGSGGPVEKIVDSNTLVPGKAYSFGSFGVHSFDGGNLAFEGLAFAGAEKGIYVAIGGLLHKVIDLSDTLDGKDVDFLFMGPEALSDNEIAFSVVFTDRTSGIYVATVPEPSLGALGGLGLVVLGLARRRRRRR